MLGAHPLVIHCLPIPTPFAVGRVNVYLVEDDPLTLVDAGPNSATSLTTLENALAEHGRKIEDLERIVVTHQHIDHIGLVQILADRSGAEVVALDSLAPWLAGYSEGMEADDAFSEAIMARHGIPEDVALRAALGEPRVPRLGRARDGDADRRARATRSSSPTGRGPSGTGRGTRLRTRSSTMRARRADRRRPPDQAHLVQPADLASPGGLRSCRPAAGARDLHGLADARRARWSSRACCPGHGEEIHGHAQLIEERFRLHERRARKLLGLIAERPSSAYELAQAMWGNVAVTQAYLTLSEVLGHVDLLRNDGHVVEHEEDGVVRFAVA